MISYYTCIMILSLAALAILGVMVWENNRLSDENKRLLYLAYSLIAISFLAEWCGLKLDGNAGLPAGLLIAVKCIDYSFSPMIGAVFAVQMGMRGTPRRVLNAVIGINVVFQIIACFTGWMVVVDQDNHYTHGKYYILYLGLCLLTMILVLAQTHVYSRAFKRRNRISMYAVMVLVAAGLLMQELLPGDYRTVYIAMIYGAALWYIQYEEYSALALDDKVLKQKIKLDTDALTGVKSRYAYSHMLKKMNAEGALPEGIAAFSIDVNGLKETNDNLGHEAGDELIRGAADCINKVFGRSGTCFRTGGDEFVVMAEMNREQAEWTLVSLESEAEFWQGVMNKRLSLAVGFAVSDEHPGCTAEKLVGEADKAMYEEKSRYYRISGKDRRRR